MNKQIEALKMAIEYIKESEFRPLKGSVLALLKEALAEAEQKEKQEEAFAELVKLNQEMGGYDMQPIKPLVEAPSITISNTTTILATWQSLSDDEIQNITWKADAPEPELEFARAIEQALKEKNHG